MAGTRMTHIPYKGAGPANADLVAGHIDMMTVAAPDALPFVRGGKTRAIAVSSRRRHLCCPKRRLSTNRGRAVVLVVQLKRRQHSVGVAARSSCRC